MCPPLADLEWRLIYVGSSEDTSKDQELECIYVGPVTVGSYRFQLEVRGSRGIRGTSQGTQRRTPLSRRRAPPMSARSPRTSWSASRPSC